jgi:hypothetical protein
MTPQSDDDGQHRRLNTVKGLIHGRLPKAPSIDRARMT